MTYKTPKSIKLVSGNFYYGEKVVLDVDGKQVERKVNYGSLDGLYVTIDGVKYGKTDFD